MEIHEFSSDIHIYYAGFSSQFIENINLMKSTQHLLPIIVENPVINLSPLQACSYKMFYESLILAYASAKTLANKEIVKAVLTMFIQGATEIYKLQSNRYLSTQSRKYEIYQEFLQLVMKNYTVHHGASFYADHLGLSLPHFCSTIKKAAGNTPLEVIASVILMDAKSRLKSSNEPVKNIALSLGFNNISFFNKFFKQHTMLISNFSNLEGVWVSAKHLKNTVVCIDGEPEPCPKVALLFFLTLFLSCLTPPPFPN